MSPFPQNLHSIQRRIAAAAQAAGRGSDSIRLVAVSKAKSEADIRAAIGAGHKVFGENRVQEAKTKFIALREEHPDLTLHMIGPLQTNKAEEAVKLFDVIETLDRPRLAVALVEAMKKTGRKPDVYIEVNIGAEPQKSGIAPDMLGAFLDFCRDGCGLTVTGLMGLPPQDKDPAPYFKKLKSLADQHALPHLSMGMSGDFEEAIRCGATEIRVGTALFGPR